MKHIKLACPGKIVDIELTRKLVTHLIQTNPGYRPSLTGRQLHAFPKTLGLTLTGSFSVVQLRRIVDIVCDGLRQPTDDLPPAP
jgi:hypothetical protein